MNDWDDELGALNDAYQSYEVKDSNFASLPDGLYQVEVEEARLERAKGSQRPQIAFMFGVLAPEAMRGRKIFHYRGLDDPERIGWVKTDLTRMGLGDMEDLRALPQELPRLIGRIIEVALKTRTTEKGEYQNCYVNRLLHDASAGDNCIDTLPPTDDDIAF